MSNSGYKSSANLRYLQHAAPATKDTRNPGQQIQSVKIKSVYQTHAVGGRPHNPSKIIENLLRH